MFWTKISLMNHDLLLLHLWLVSCIPISSFFTSVISLYTYNIFTFMPSVHTCPMTNMLKGIILVIYNFRKHLWHAIRWCTESYVGYHKVMLQLLHHFESINIKRISLNVRLVWQNRLRTHVVTGKLVNVLPGLTTELHLTLSFQPFTLFKTTPSKNRSDKWKVQNWHLEWLLSCPQSGLVVPNLVS